MLGSTAVEVAVGLILVFFVFSLLVSALNEGLATLFDVRAKYLITGIRKLVDGDPDPRPDPDPSSSRALPTQDQVKVALTGATLTHWIYKHPIIDDLKRPGWRNRRRKPSYISSRNFSRALVDVLVPDAQGDTSLDRIRSSVASLDDKSGLKRPLLALIDEANGDITAFRTAVQGWFDDQMQSVSGWYKRWSRKVLFALGVLVAIGLNVDTVAVARDLWRNVPLRAAVVAQASEAEDCQPGESQLKCADRQLAGLDKLPIGWTADEKCLDGQPCDGWTAKVGDLWSRIEENGTADNLMKLLGWGLTAGALSFGAPFWFDLLSKVGPLRNAKAPAEAREGAS